MTENTTTPNADSPDIRPGTKPDEFLLFDHGFVRLDACMADDLSVVNSARVSFAVRKEEMDERDKGLIKFLMRDRHGTPFEHNSFRFHVRTPIFVAREWFRHRVSCLTGSTRVTFEDGVERTVYGLWREWLRDPAHVRALPVRVLNEAGGTFEAGSIAGVVDQGVQPVLRVELADGSVLEATANHRVLTSEGWARLGAALRAPAPRLVTAPRRALVFNGRQATTREQSSEAEVVRVTPLGRRHTYDLSIAGPWHNFVAEGVVVHNSFNEESARYHKLESDFYVPEPYNVRTQVGKPGAYRFEPVEDAVAKDTIETFDRVYDEAYSQYQRLIEQGVAKEVARSLLPMGIYTQFYWTLNARSMMNFLSLRNDDSAQYEIRLYAEAIERLFAVRMPLTHACFVEFGRKAP